MPRRSYEPSGPNGKYAIRCGINFIVAHLTSPCQLQRAHPEVWPSESSISGPETSGGVALIGVKLPKNARLTDLISVRLQTSLWEVDRLRSDYARSLSEVPRRMRLGHGEDLWAGALSIKS